MKRLLVCILFVLLLPLALAQVDQSWMYTAKLATYNVDIGADISVQDVSSLEADVSLFPHDGTTRQTVEYEGKQPKNEILSFSWNSPQSTERLDHSSAVRVTNNRVQVQEAPFPLNKDNIPSEYTKYMSPSSLIDFDTNSGEVSQLASEILSGVQGDLDQYVVIHELAVWVKNNIDYSLDTVTMKASQPASWVLQNKVGVCDELTNLFIAMVRSVGIPARFISGYAYTDSERIGRGWGPHGWAEVYFPEYGWIPVDVTYRQIGWLDMTHVKMKHANDANDPSVRYRWVSGKVNPSQLQVNVQPLTNNGKVSDMIKATARPYKETIGFGSHNAIIVELENTQDHYVSQEFRVATSDSVELTDKKRYSLLFGPNEVRTIVIPIKVKQALNQNFRYTSQIDISSPFSSTQTAIIAVNGEEQIKKKEIDQLIALQKKESAAAAYSRFVKISCEASKEELYIYEDTHITCELENTGDKTIKEAQFCALECETADILPFETKKITQEYNPSEHGILQAAVAQFLDEQLNVFKSTVIPLSVKDIPRPTIAINYQEEINYDDTQVIDYTVSTTGGSELHKVKIHVTNNGEHVHEDYVEKLSNHRFVLRIPASSLDATNNFKIAFNYVDNNENEYETEEEFTFDLVNLTLTQRTKLFLTNLVY